MEKQKGAKYKNLWCGEVQHNSANDDLEPSQSSSSASDVTSSSAPEVTSSAPDVTSSSAPEVTSSAPEVITSSAPDVTSSAPDVTSSTHVAASSTPHVVDHNAPDINSNCDFEGNNVTPWGIIEIATVEDCQKKCVENHYCHKFAYSAELKQCWLKDEFAVNKKIKNGISCGTVSGKSPLPPPSKVILTLNP
eukprot:Pgem_evm1s5200